MIMDKLATFSESQALSGTALGAVPYDTFPQGGKGGFNPTRDIGSGEGVYLTVNVVGGGMGAGTVNFELESSDAFTFDSGLEVSHFRSGPIPVSELTVGANPVAVKLPKGEYKRFLNLRYVCSSNPSIVVTAGLVLDTQSNRAYASGYTVT